MRKRLIYMVLAVVLVVSLLAGCGNQDSETTNDSSGEVTTDELQDGTYLVKDPVSDHGNYGMAKMEVVGGEVSTFEYVEILADSGDEKDENNYNYPEGLEVIKNLNEQFNETKDLNEVDFDAISGATSTKENFQRIVNKLYAKASEGDIYEPVYEDGVYTAEAEEDSHGWLGEVKVVVKDGQIVGLDYCETAIEDMESSRVVFDEDGKEVMDDEGKPVTETVQVSAGEEKSPENYAYMDSFEVINQMQKSLIDNNGTENLDVDSITGATNTRSTIVELVDKALEDAKL
ncbi:FMN-binding protein [Schnuerera sp. xch1]|uniref:FMN-binding protein n=1 Tax=Schnuerera sp. xch1 TaxID=2874283 RepID=UPI001CBFD8B2|nr:FMN-binding protein [Schnuerera sp. xch1]MBZ2175347.1 FMN-binding protein [Schnuerera sp. xch1]